MNKYDNEDAGDLDSANAAGASEAQAEEQESRRKPAKLNGLKLRSKIGGIKSALDEAGMAALRHSRSDYRGVDEVDLAHDYLDDAREEINRLETYFNKVLTKHEED